MRVISYFPTDAVTADQLSATGPKRLTVVSDATCSRVAVERSYADRGDLVTRVANAITEHIAADLRAGLSNPLSIEVIIGPDGS